MTTVHHARLERDIEDRARVVCSCGAVTEWHEPTYRRGRSSEPPDPASAREATKAWKAHVRDADTAEATPMADLLRRQTQGRMEPTSPFGSDAETSAGGRAGEGQAVGPGTGPTGKRAGPLPPGERDQEALW